MGPEFYEQCNAVDARLKEIETEDREERDKKEN
jgi:hypothetical protein